MSIHFLNIKTRTHYVSPKEYVHLKGKCEGATLLPCQIEPNWPLLNHPCQYDGWGMPGRRAVSPVSVYAWAHCREPKTGQQKVQFYCKDDFLWPSCYYLSMVSPFSLYWTGDPTIKILWYKIDYHFRIFSKTMDFFHLKLD